MKFNGTHINKELLLSADVLNTVSGGMSKPTVTMERKADKYILKAMVPGVSAENMQLEIKDNQLFLFHHITMQGEEFYGGVRSIPYSIGIFMIPYDVDIDGIRAVYEDRQLKIILPFNEMANGYHKHIHIQKS